MSINSEEIKVTTRLPREVYLKLRDASFKSMETKQSIVARAIDREVDRMKKGEPKPKK